MLNKRLGLLLVAVATLSGCQAVSETFDKNIFHTQDFLDNYYRIIPERYKRDNYEVITYEVSDKVLLSSTYISYKPVSAFEPIILDDIENNRITLQKVVEKYGDDDVKNIKRSSYSSDEEYTSAIIEAMRVSKNVTWREYATENSLTGSSNPVINESFKKGIFSKLTDAIIVCDGSGSLVRMQIDEAGMGQVFAHELINYNNLVLIARGGTNIVHQGVRIKSSKIEFNVSFYIEKSTTNAAQKHEFKYVIDDFGVDNNSETNVMKINLNEIAGDKLKRASGITISYKLLEHDILMPGGNPPIVPSDDVFAVMLYEFMLPFSSWR